MQKWGALGWLGGTQGQRQCHHSKERIRLPIRPKVADFDPPHLHLAPPQGVTPVAFRGDLWHQETRFPGLLCGVVCVILCLAVLLELRLVTDVRTDRQTDTEDIGPWLVPRQARMHSITR